VQEAEQQGQANSGNPLPPAEIAEDDIELSFSEEDDDPGRREQVTTWNLAK
jgi:hypothetical protein